ncbi:MAG TPA: hypothetical protein VFG91_13675 [Woeseiaceae bacterium]|nr:hypothetical protein [Woeseiaceae bacterium]
MRVIARHWFRALVRENFLRDRKAAALLANESLSSDESHFRQERLLRKTLLAASRRIPAYRDFDVPADDVRSALQALPVVTKRHLLAGKGDYFPALGLDKLWTARGLTSGTTGTPLEIFRSLSSVIWESAFINRHWQWSGFAKGMRRATLRGDYAVPASRTSAPFWLYNQAENQLLVSSRHLHPPYIASIARELREFQPYLLHAYPSTAYELALHLEHVDEYLEIPVVYTSSEMLYTHQRELISSRLKTRLFDHYGMAERVAFITECEAGSYHVNPEYSYVEILDDDGNPTSDSGYITGTTFHNSTMPLIRYRLSDRSRWKPGTCACGRNYPMVEPIEGKYEDRIFGSSGNPVSPSLVTFAFKGLRNIERSQVAQIAAGRWEIRVVPMQGYSAAERSALMKNVREMVDPGIDVTVIECEDIPRTEAGKYRWVVNECAVPAVV